MISGSFDWSKMYEDLRSKDQNKNYCSPQIEFLEKFGRN